jgi:hypothetical protein
MDIVEELNAALENLKDLHEPVTSEELASQLGAISEALEKCERALIWLATNPSRSEEMITYLFEYKQLLLSEKRLSQLSLPQPEVLVDTPKRRWKFW